MTTTQSSLDLRPSERVGDALRRIRRDAASEAEKGRWFEHLFMATVRDNPEFDVAHIWPWREWPARARLDAAAGECLGLRPETVADWRERIVREPTVSNRPAAPFEHPGDFISFLRIGPSLEGLHLERDRRPPRDIELPLNVKVPPDAEP